ncbi:MAG: DUF1552 domain-containing protein [Planctomycetaceae bacterium]|jgi:hypothetical protein|nr:DUF1552 domain-containing protein [Planctomycetaceae bacterium]
MSSYLSRREFAKSLGIASASVPFLLNLGSLVRANSQATKQRLIVVFSPNGVIPPNFWPDEEGENFSLKRIMAPLEPFKNRLLTLHGVSDKIRGDGDSHMRGMGCLLTGIELYPGNIQGGSDTPAGWASGISIDQEIKNYLQSKPETQTRFGSLEFGVGVPSRADTWTRMVYAGPNRPIAPIDQPQAMFNKLYGQRKDQDTVRSILDDLQADLAKLRSKVSQEDRRLLDEHEALVREFEKQLTPVSTESHIVPEIDSKVEDSNDNIPTLTRQQMDLMLHAIQADFARIFTFQFTNSVGQAKMRWLGIEEDHHGLSHEPDSNEQAVEKLTKINIWYCEQIAYLAQKLAEIPEPGGNGSLLDNTTILWTNELGKGNSHTLENIPFVLIGGGLGFRTGRSLKYKSTPHNRLLMSLAHGFGHQIGRFGNENYCNEGPLALS